MGQTFKKAPVIWSAKTLENIGKADYGNVAAVRASTGGLQKRLKPAGGKQ